MTDVQERAARFIRAFNDHDENAMRVLNDPNHTLTAPGGVRLRGAETTSYPTQWIKACPDAKLTVENEISCGEWVVQEVKFEGIHQGPLESPMGRIQATGKTLAVQSALITRYQNDLAIETKIYVDAAEVLNQLGLLATPVAATV